MNADEGEIFIGVDCGGTNLRAAAAGRDGRLVAQLTVPTWDAAERENGLGEAIRALARDLRDSVTRDSVTRDRVTKDCATAGVSAGLKIGGVGVGLPFTCHEGRAYLCRNVSALDPAWLERSLAADLGAPARLMNDVKCAALGEAWLGAAAGAAEKGEPFVFLNVGTGLSMAFYSGTEVLQGVHHAAGEIGYWVADAGDPGGFAEGYGPLEEIVSGVGFQGAYRAASARVGDAKARGGLGETIGAEEVFRRADAGDAIAAAVVERGIAHLLPAMANIATLLDPGLLVLGGGVSKGLEPYAGRIDAYLAHMTPFPPRVLFSTLGGKAGLLGAIRLAML
jgi:glucokinase